MNEDLLIENSNREEVSRFKNSIVGYLKKWPYLLLSVVVCILVVYFVLKKKQNVYKVNSKVLIEKSQQISNPTELIFGNQGGGKRFAGLADEATIFKSYPLIKSTLEELNFDVIYTVERDWNEVEIYNESPITLTYDKSQAKESIPYSSLFKFTAIDNSKFQLSVETISGEEIHSGEYNYDEQIQLNEFEFTISRNLDNWNLIQKNSKINISLKSLVNETYVYQNRLNFEEGEGQSKILSLSLKSKTPEKSIDFINTLINRYINQNLTEKNKVSQATVDFIDSQLAVISDSLNNKEKNLEEFKSSTDLSSISIEGQSLITKFNKIESEKAEYEVMQQYYDYLQSSIENSDETNLQNLIAPSAFGITDDIINSLVNSLIELNINKAQLLENGNDKNPLLEQIDRRIVQISNTLKESLENLSNANKIILNDLNDRSRNIINQAKKLPNTERQLVNLNRLLMLNENIYLFLMEKRSSAAITLSSNVPDCKVIEPAMLNPLGPIAPNRKMYYLVSVLIGIILPLVVFILLDFLNSTIRDKEEVMSLTNIPIMGLIPNSKFIKDNKIVFNQPKSVLAESFRTIRTNLMFYQQGKVPFVIMVTSTVAKEGKTFCAINLAASLAASGKKTVLLGFDLRKPQIHNYLSLSDKEGVSNYLTGSVGIKDIVQSTSEKNLYVVTSGAIPPNPAELIATSRTSELLDELKSQFDVIILDTPPIGLVADSLLLQKESDLNLYLVRQNYSKREFLNQANELYDSSKMENLCIVYNGVDKSSSYKYGYYDQEKEPKRRFFMGNKA